MNKYPPIQTWRAKNMDQHYAAYLALLNENWIDAIVAAHCKRVGAETRANRKLLDLDFDQRFPKRK